LLLLRRVVQMQAMINKIATTATAPTPMPTLAPTERPDVDVVEPSGVDDVSLALDSVDVVGDAAVELGAELLVAAAVGAD
jgi:hypothetical protein